MGIKCPKCHFDNLSDSKFCKECGTQLLPAEEISISQTKTFITPEMGFHIGSTFARRYKIIGKLGEGGMGVVYKAEDTKLKRTVALKFLPPELTHITEVKERFIREAQASAALDHPNICTVHEIDDFEGKTFISMACVEGQSLRDKVKSGPLEVNESLEIAIQVAEGLEEAHKEGIVHRDIKSANIMVTGKGQAKIMDFGLAKVRGATLVTREGTTMGTVAYMSPEQARGETVDHRTDIWSLGVVLYEMISGQLPFKGERETSVMYSIEHKEPKPLKAIQPDTSEELEQIVGKALTKNQGERYQKIDELLDDLYSISKGFVPPKIKAAIRRARLSKMKKTYLYAGIASLSVLLIAAGIYLFIARSNPIDSIAVLPLENLSGDIDTEYLSDGITESLINKLSQLPSLKKVIARGSVFRYKGKEIDPQAVGQELGVEAVLMSQMNQHGDELSISVELMKVQDNSHIWGNQYKRKISEIIAIQEEISNSIANSLRLSLTGKELKGLTKRHTEDNEAYQLYLKGRYFWNKRTAEDIRKAIDYFEKAIKLDTNYALAYAGLADTYNISPLYTSLRSKEALSKAKAAVMKALDIDETLAEAHAALGFIRTYNEWNWEAAETELKRAIQIKPNYVTAHHWYAEYLTAMGRHKEAIAEIRRAHELDPLSLIINCMKAWVFLFARQYERAIEQCQQTLELDPNFALAHSLLGWAYLEKGMYEEAIVAYQERRGELRVRFAYAYALPGKRDESLRMLEEMKERWKRGEISAYSIARVYAGLGEEDMVLEWLEKSFEKREAWMVRLNVDPTFDSLRSKPRFKALLKKMNLPFLSY